MKRNNEQLLRKLPSVDVLLQEADLKSIIGEVPHRIAVKAIRDCVQQMRELITEGKATELSEDTICQEIAEKVIEKIKAAMKPGYRKVINATGIILHTGLGRAVLSAPALQQIQNELQSYSLLQLDVETGKRSKRDECIEWLLNQLTGCEAATVVNNNAAATFIVLNTFAKGKEVIVSRGQLVEIGGSFRLPDVMAFSGAKLVEVGTTNKTHARDYANAITENTTAILRVHPSNYKIQGFSSEVPLEDMVEIAHSNNLIVIDDIGAGALIDFSKLGFEYEPTLNDSVAKGADIITSSADKLIGASQGGILLGKAKLIEAVRQNQFSRIVRPGKLTLAVLEATLRLFLDESVALREVPTLQMLSRNLSDISTQAKQIASRLQETLQEATVTIIDGFSQMGSGSLPAQGLATKLVAVNSNKTGATALAKQLRRYNPAIFARIQNDQVLIDPRTIRDDEDEVVIKALLEILY